MTKINPDWRVLRWDSLKTQPIVGSPSYQCYRTTNSCFDIAPNSDGFRLSFWNTDDGVCNYGLFDSLEDAKSEAADYWVNIIRNIENILNPPELSNNQDYQNG